MPSRDHSTASPPSGSTAGLDPARPSTPGDAGHMPALDAVRGFAIIAVLMHHLAVYTPGNDVPGRVYAAFAEFFAHGVDLFFALSGYLLVRHFAETPPSSGWLRRFWLRRAAKIVPLYALVLLGLLFALPVLLNAAGLAAKLPDQSLLVSELPWHAAFVSHWLYFKQSGFGYPLLNVAWSLGIEIEFYVLLCLFVAAGAVRSVRLWIGVAVLAVAARAAGVGAGWDWVRILTFFPGRLDVFAAGALVALRPDWFGKPVRLAGAALLLVPILLGWSRQSAWVQLFGYAWVALGSACLIRFATDSSWHRIVPRALARPLVFFGLVSYSIYLTHLILRSGLRDVLLPKERLLTTPGDWLTWLAYVGGTAVAAALVGWLAWRFVESPAQRFLLARFRAARPRFSPHPPTS